MSTTPSSRNKRHQTSSTQPQRKRKREISRDSSPLDGGTDSTTGPEEGDVVDLTTTPSREGLTEDELKTPTSGTLRRPKSQFSPFTTRANEQIELQELNKRLEFYILKMRQKDNSQGGVFNVLSDLREHANAELTATRRLYDEKLNDMRKTRDLLTGKNAELQQEVRRLTNLIDEKNKEIDKDKEYTEELERKVEELTKELQDAKSQLFNVEMKIKQLETELEIEKNNNKMLRADLEKQRARADSAIAEQVKSENKARTKDEDYQLLLMKNKQQVETYEKKVDELSGAHTSVEDALRKEFVQQLETILAERQAQYEEEKAAGLSQLKSAYDDKMKGYRESVEQLSHDVEQEKARADAFHQQLEEMKNESLEAIAVKDSLQKRVQEQQELIDSLRKKHAQDIHEKIEYIQKLKATFNKKDKEFDELLDVKIALAMEIKAYRQLIENEEERLGYQSPIKKRKLTDDHTAQISNNIN